MMVVSVHDTRFQSMNVALESLMREPPLRSPRPAGGGITSFLLIGGGAAASFVALSSALVDRRLRLLPNASPSTGIVK